MICTFNGSILEHTCLNSWFSMWGFLIWRQVPTLHRRCVFRGMDFRFHNRNQIHVDLTFFFWAASIDGVMDLLARRRADLLEFVYRLRHRNTIICDVDSLLQFKILINMCQPQVVPLSKAILTGWSRDYISEILVLFYPLMQNSVFRIGY